MTLDFNKKNRKNFFFKVSPLLAHQSSYVRVSVSRSALRDSSHRRLKKIIKFRNKTRYFDIIKIRTNTSAAAIGDGLEVDSDGASASALRRRRHLSAPNQQLFVLRADSF